MLCRTADDAHDVLLEGLRADCKRIVNIAAELSEASQELEAAGPIDDSTFLVALDSGHVDQAHAPKFQTLR